MKQKKRIRSLTAITVLLAICLLLVWSLGMFYLTRATAQLFYTIFSEQCYGFSSYADYLGKLSELYGEERQDTPSFCNDWIGGLIMQNQTSSFSLEDTAVPGYWDYCMLRTLNAASDVRFTPLELSPWYDKQTSIFSEKDICFQTAVAFYDSEGKLLHESGDYIYFPYVTEAVWEAGGEDGPCSGYAYIELGEDAGAEDPYSLFRNTYAGVHSLYNFRALRITGYLDGAKLTPVKIDYITDSHLFQALEAGDVYEYTINSLLQEGLLEWVPQMDSTDQVMDDSGLVTLYALRPEMTVYDPGQPVSYQGTEYAGLLSLLDTVGAPYYFDNAGHLQGGNDLGIPSTYNMDRIVALGFRQYADKEAEGGPPELIMLTAVSCQPVQAAVTQLRYAYIATALLALVLLLFLRGCIRRNLLQHLEEVNSAFDNGWKLLPSQLALPPRWREPYALKEHYQNTQDQLRKEQNEITRLNTALDYAKAAEQQRRQMTSNIAHELKTPLAVIHSYAEGLQAHIADEKREQYLSVILSETERMDAMVLEMLDLSRLEAGKVKLARDSFSLSALVRSILDKFTPLMEEKQLRLTLLLEGECPVTADEARVGQVITNLVSNAVRYAPQSGAVSISTYTEGRKTGFSIENTSRPFTKEELTKVWEPFYRTDPSRSGKSTGLGLAIVKNIIDLHGGMCKVQNTDTGVRFCFTLPD